MTRELGLRHGTWVVVCDGAKALVFENVGHAGAPRLKTRKVKLQNSPPTHLQGASPPGRAFGAGGRRAAVEQTDFHTQIEDRFLTSFAAALETDLDEGKARGLFLIAPPKALGVLREGLGEKARKLVCGELARDYSGMPVDEIERKLQAAYDA
jgi:protein required for attachment to host cells